jgi:hypothetical protein
MQVIGLFALFVVVLDAIAVGVCSIIEMYSEYASLIVFLLLYAANFIIAWKAALYLTEHYLIVEERREAPAPGHAMLRNSR